jgi:hypothetical protein
MLFVSQRLKSSLVLQSPPTRTNRTPDLELTEPYWVVYGVIAKLTDVVDG